MSNGEKSYQSLTLLNDLLYVNSQNLKFLFWKNDHFYALVLYVPLDADILFFG